MEFNPIDKERNDRFSELFYKKFETPIHIISQKKYGFLCKFLDDKATLEYHFDQYFWTSKNIILNEKGSFIINKKVKNENLNLLLNDIINEVKILQCFKFKKNGIFVYPKIGFTLNFIIENNIIKLNKYKVFYSYFQIKDYSELDVYTHNVLLHKIEHTNSFYEIYSESKECKTNLLKKIKPTWTKILNSDYSDSNFIDNVVKINSLLDY